MPFRSMEQGIEAIRAGNHEEGARLLRIALRSEKLNGKVRAVAYVWLAETQTSRAFKIECLEKAMEADPGNQKIAQRMANLMELPENPANNHLPGTGPLGDTGSQQAQPGTGPLNPQWGDTGPQGARSGTGPLHRLPGTGPLQQRRPGTGPLRPPSDSQPLNPYDPPPMQSETQRIQQQQHYQNPYGTPEPQTFNQNFTYRTVGIMGGPNGPGTGFFVTRDGLLATTRYVTGGMTHVMVNLDQNLQLTGKVVRSYPAYDLALIRVGTSVDSLLTISAQRRLPENLPLTAYAHQSTPMRGQRRATKRNLPPHWIPTTITKLTDAGGNPVFDDSNYLLGMLTKNASRTSEYLYALHVAKVHEMVQQYIAEMQESSNRMYCPSCGHASQAAAYGAFYCEICGSTLPYAQERQRFPQPQLASLYGEGRQMACPNCQSSAGFYKNVCLRCGHDLNPQ